MSVWKQPLHGPYPTDGEVLSLLNTHLTLISWLRTRKTNKDIVKSGHRYAWRHPLWVTNLYQRWRNEWTFYLLNTSTVQTEKLQNTYTRQRRRNKEFTRTCSKSTSLYWSMSIPTPASALLSPRRIPLDRLASKDSRHVGTWASDIKGEVKFRFWPRNWR